jgi:hypothetical protein
MKSIYLTACLAGLALTGCQKESTGDPATQFGEVDIALEHVVGPMPLVLNTVTYTTPAGDPFIIKKFSYYLSNIKLGKDDGSEYAQPESYYLVDVSDGDTQRIVLKDVPVGDYTSISFTIGVDSARSVAGAQTDALDPAKGMFWDRTSGYISAKFEGSSTVSPAPNGALLFNVGGFRRPNNTIHTVSPPFNGAKILVRTDHYPEIHYSTDLLKLFTGPNTVRFATLSTINTVSAAADAANAVKIADNYAQGMFTVLHIHAN